MAFPLLLLAFFLLPFFFLLLLKNPKNKLNLPPGPTNLPIIGSLHKLGQLPHRSLRSLSLTYGPLIHLNLGSVPTVVASSADTARAFLKTHDLDCCSRPFSTAWGRLSYGFADVAFAPYGEQWRERRKMCIVELFSNKKVASFRPIREEEVARMVEEIGRKEEVVDLSEVLVMLCYNITCRTAMGKR